MLGSRSNLLASLPLHSRSGNLRTFSFRAQRVVVHFSCNLHLPSIIGLRRAVLNSHLCLCSSEIRQDRWSCAHYCRRPRHNNAIVQLSRKGRRKESETRSGIGGYLGLYRCVSRVCFPFSFVTNIDFHCVKGYHGRSSKSERWTALVGI